MASEPAARTSPEAAGTAKPGKDRRMRYPLLWLAFIIVLGAGAALISSGSTALQWLGLTLVAAPLVALGLLTVIYYFVERNRA